MLNYSNLNDFHLLSSYIHHTLSSTRHRKFMVWLSFLLVFFHVKSEHVCILHSIHIWYYRLLWFGGGYIPFKLIFGNFFIKKNFDEVVQKSQNKLRPGILVKMDWFWNTKVVRNDTSRYFFYYLEFWGTNMTPKCP